MATTKRPDSWASSPAARKSMQSNRSRDTRPELVIRRSLHARGLRYRVCTRPLPQLRRTADIVFRPLKLAVEIRGCFWHGCPDHHRLPAANREYWSNKVDRNMRRDRETEEVLAAAGWKLIVVWEHEDLLEAADRVYQEVNRLRSLGAADAK